MGSNDAWAAALEEAESPDRRDKGLWARCFAESGGDDAKAKVAYVTAKVAPSRSEPPSKAFGYCPNCGVSCEMKASSCYSCRTDFSNRRPVADKPMHIGNPSVQIVRTAKSRGVYIILALLFGMLGIHNFYAGRFGVGAAQFLSTVILGWFVIGIFVTGIWVVVDIFTVKEDGKGFAFD